MKILLRHTEYVEIELEQVVRRPGHGLREYLEPSAVTVQELQDYLNAGGPGGASPVAISLNDAEVTKMSPTYPTILERRQIDPGWVVTAIDDKVTGR